MPFVMNTSDRLYHDFIRFLFLYAHREASALARELPEESDQFRFLRVVWLTHLKGYVGLILTNDSTMRVSIHVDLSTRSFIPLPRFILSRRPPPPSRSFPRIPPSALCLSRTCCAFVFEIRLFCQHSFA